MIRISKEEKDYLISIKALKITGGKFVDLHIASRQKKHGGKTYYVPDYYARHLKKKIK